jgi:opacity protein-like surface antigen
MKKLLSLIFLAAICLFAVQPADIAGAWQMSCDAPHGPVHGTLTVRQQGAQWNATFAAGDHGTFNVIGTVEGNRIAFSINAPEGHAFSFTGAIEGNKMSGQTEHGGAWSAERQQ